MTATYRAAVSPTHGEQLEQPLERSLSVHLLPPAVRLQSVRRSGTLSAAAESLGQDFPLPDVARAAQPQGGRNDETEHASRCRSRGGSNEQFSRDRWDRLGVVDRAKAFRKPAECENPKADDGSPVGSGKCRHQLFQAQASAIGIHHRLRHREHLSRQRIQRSALLGGPVVAPVDAGNATAAAADAVQHRFCHFEPKLFQAWCERSVGSLRPSLHKNAATSSAVSAMFKHDRNPL
jgi:hypothetical protein